MLCHVVLHTENIAHIIIINLCPHVSVIVKLILVPGRRTRLPLGIDWKKQYLQLYYEQVSQFPHHWDGLYW